VKLTVHSQKAGHDQNSLELEDDADKPDIDPHAETAHAGLLEEVLP
jgi:hypothetical protein